MQCVGAEAETRCPAPPARRRLQVPGGVVTRTFASWGRTFHEFLFVCLFRLAVAAALAVPR